MKHIDPVKTLRFPEVAPGRAMHGALVHTLPSRGPGELHRHADFREFFLVVGGRGIHQVNGRAGELQAGELMLMRPADVHGYRVRAGQTLTFINVAFPEVDWQAFRELAEVGEGWDAASDPPSWGLGPVAHGQAEGIFRQALADFRHGGRAVHRSRFLGALLPLLVEEPVVEVRADVPEWLERAMVEMERPGNVALGLPRFVELAGVSLPHLCRTMRARTGRTPTEFLNELRVRQAAALLATTSLELGEIADRCGFESLSYLHRQFRGRMGVSPLGYRRAEGSRVVR